MKKLASIILALALTVAMAIPAFATTATITDGGTITITNATKDQTYTLYKIFSAKATEDGTGVNYMAANDAVFDYLFNNPNNVNGENAYFLYNTTTKEIVKRATASDSDLVNYLTELVHNETVAATLEKKVVIASSETVTFEGLNKGYYVIDRAVDGSTSFAVTITGNNENVEVIDKNQYPGGGFSKKVANVSNEGVIGAYVEDKNSANIGDVVNYKVSVQATRYHGSHQIQYYQIYDKKGSALWVDFASVEVSVGGTVLPRGYFLDLTGTAGGTFTNDKPLTTIGNWGDTEKVMNNAQWYLVYMGEDEFRVTIPWLSGYKISHAENTNNYSLAWPDGAEKNFLYGPSVTIEVTYNAAIEADAVIGGGTSDTMTNTAYASWSCEKDTHTTGENTVYTEVFGIGLLKEDFANGDNLAGAKFTLTTESGEAVNVIPTKIDGVYMVDSKDRRAEGVNGDVLLSREHYHVANGYVASNIVESQANGKLVVLGLAAGKYKLVEVEPPAGYNTLTDPVVVEVAQPDTAPEVFVVYANENGQVYDTQQDKEGYTAYSYSLYTVTVTNSKGAALPETGAQGTMMLVGGGAMMVMVAAIFLVTRKKMSIYED